MVNVPITPKMRTSLSQTLILSLSAPNSLISPHPTPVSGCSGRHRSQRLKHKATELAVVNAPPETQLNTAQPNASGPKLKKPCLPQKSPPPREASKW